MVKFRDLLLLAGGVAAASHACALSLGNSSGKVLLGNPVNLIFAAQADPGQTLDSSCITADIWMGDHALDQGHISVTALAHAVHVRSTVPVYEPLVTVKLRAGCSSALSRSYTFFADPPQALAASLQPIDLSKISAAPMLTTTAGASPSAPRSAATPAKPRRVAKRPVKPQAAIAAAPAPSVSEAPMPPTPAEVPAPSAASASATANGSTNKPRLRMEPLDSLETPATASPADAGTVAPPTDTADTSTPPATSQADAHTLRLAALEQQLLEMQTQLSQSHSAMATLQTQLRQAQNPALPGWVYAMLGLLALALGTIAWLLQRLRQERTRAQHAWTDTVLAAESALPDTRFDATPHSHFATAATTSTAAAAPPLSAPMAAAPLPPVQPTKLTSVATPPAVATQPPAQLLPPEATLEVQQEAEFYTSIGENDQAIALLHAYIAAHKSTAPQAYLDLLQLLHRLSRKDGFAHVREQLQAHFNVQAPDFQYFFQKGQNLRSGYPDVCAQIEAAWASETAIPVLQALIVRTAEQPATALPFDMAAFEDLLMLYGHSLTSPQTSQQPFPPLGTAAANCAVLPELTLSLPESDAAPLPLFHSPQDMLSAATSAEPLSPTGHPSDSPFQSPARFAPNEALVNDLSIDWDALPMSPPVTGDPQRPSTRPDARKGD